MTAGEQPRRVRVTGPRTGAGRAPVRRALPAAEIDRRTRLGEVYLSSLMREQRWLAVRTLAALALTVGLLPLAFHLLPGLAGVAVLGLPLPWLLLGVGVYPWLVLLGWQFVRRAERVEQDFADLLREER